MTTVHPSAVPHQPRPMPGIPPNIRFWLPFGLGLLGLALHMTAQDRVPIVAGLHYALWWPVIAALFAAAAVANRRRRWALIPALLILGGWAASQWRSGPSAMPDRDGDVLRVGYWNHGYGTLDPDRIIGVIREHRLDILAIGESPDWTGSTPATFEAALPGFTVVPPVDTISAFLRGDLIASRRHDLPGRDRCRTLRLTVRGNALDLHVVDLDPNPLRHRSGPLAEIQRHAAPRAGRPSLLAGDFNTPSTSPLFDGIRCGYRHAFDTAGAGWRPTWPRPFPIFELDHIWASPDWDVLRCEHHYPFWSDHAMVLTEIRLGPSQ